MAKKQKQNTLKKQQRALHKRTQRKKKIAQRAIHESASERPTSVLRRSREFPFLGAWVQRDWQQYGIASLVVARTQPDNDIVFGRYLVDTFCVGLKDTFFGVNLELNQFHNDALPRLYSGEPPMTISIELAHEIIHGAIEFAEAIGFRPHRLFQRTKNILDAEDTHPRSGIIEFGHLGKPTYIPAPSDNQRMVLNRLVQNVGIGNFNFVPSGPIPDGFEELLQQAQGQDVPTPPVPDSPIWTPEQQAASGNVDSDSGLWVPNQTTDAPNTEQTEAPSQANDEQPVRSSLWVPGT
jgi:hypothetical protein